MGVAEAYSRSVELYNVRYLFYSGDGGSKTCVSINEAQVNGPDINKLECMYRPHAEAYGHPASEMRAEKTTFAETWCKYNPAKMETTSYYHSKNFHLLPVVMEKIKPIFKDFCKTVPLEKWHKGKTPTLTNHSTILYGQ